MRKRCNRLNYKDFYLLAAMERARKAEYPRAKAKNRAILKRDGGVGAFRLMAYMESYRLYMIGSESTITQLEDSCMNRNKTLIDLLKQRIGLLKSLSAMKGKQSELFRKMCGVVGTYSSGKVDLLTRMVEFVEENVAGTGHQSKLAGRYTGQPSGCGRLTLTYGYLQYDGKIVRWVARIYFTRSGPRMGFPIECLKLASKEKVDTGKKAFSPQDRYIEDFFKYPGNYLDWNKLKAR